MAQSGAGCGMKLSRSRNILHRCILAFGGVLVALAVGGVLVLAGLIRFEWSDRWLRRRGLEEAQSRPRRVLVLGDSFLTDWPVEHCLFKDLERYCGQREIGLVNRAWGGFGPYEYLDQIESVGPDFKPGLVLLFYYAGNDLTDVQYRDVETPHRRGDENESSPSAAAAAPARLADLLLGAFMGSARAASPSDPASFDWEAYAEHGIDRQLIEWAQNRIRHPNRIGREYVNPWLLEMAMAHASFLTDNILMDRPENRGASKKIRALLGRIDDAARDLDAQLCVVAIPSTVQVDRSHYDFYLKATFDVNERLLTSTAPQDLLAGFCRDRAIASIDLLPLFKAHPDPSALYWECDDHLSETGHVLAFDALRSQFLDNWSEKSTAASPRQP